MRYQERVLQDATDEGRLLIVSRRVTSSPALGWILAVPLDVPAMSASHLLIRDKIWLAEKKSQMYSPRCIFHHHRRFDGIMRGGAYGENAVVFHKDGRRVADGADYFLANFLAPDLGIVAHRDRPSKLIGDRC